MSLHKKNFNKQLKKNLLDEHFSKQLAKSYGMTIEEYKNFVEHYFSKNKVSKQYQNKINHEFFSE